MTNAILREVDMSNTVIDTGPKFEFEFLSYPLHWYKPLSILKCRDEETMAIIILMVNGTQSLRELGSKSHPLTKLLFSRLPKSMRKKLPMRTVLYAVNKPVDLELFKASYRGVTRQGSKQWLAPAGLDRGVCITPSATFSQ